MRDRKAEWYRDWAKEKPPSPWVDRLLTVLLIVALVMMIVTVLRNV